ncbi:IS630 family transposase [Methylosinus sp. KRF6]|nr:IS630 family transposase [Methylosinus sp. KRF6]
MHPALPPSPIGGAPKERFYNQVGVILGSCHAEWRSVVSANSRSDPRQAFLAQRGVSGRGAASGAGLHLCARHPAAARPGRAREGVSSSCGKPRQLLRGRAVPLYRHRRKDPAAELRRFRRSRPSAPHDQRTVSTYIFGVVCPKDGKGAALVLPACNTYAMNLLLAEITKNVAPDAHAALIVDRAGWHMTDKLVVPPNITLVPLPAKCPELNPAENVWQFLRENWLSNRVFKSYDDIVDHCCVAWNKLIDQPWRIMSIGLRDWAHGF